MNFLFRALLVCTLIFAETSLGFSQNHHRSRSSSKSQSSNKMDVVSYLASNRNFATLVAGVKAADLVETLQGNGPFTVFAPSDAAFAALPKGTLEKLLKPENRSQLIKILTYHVVPGRIEASDIEDGASLKSVQGEKIKTQINGNTVLINNALVKTANIRTGNGVIHTIDRVILPPSL